MSSYWLRLYTEIMDDKKLTALSDYQFRVFILCLAYAKEINENGQLRPTSDIAWRLRTAEKPIESALGAMRAIGIVDENERGWFLVNFAKRQTDHASSAERVRAFRERQKLKNEPEPRNDVTLPPLSISLSSSSLSSLSDSSWEE